MKILIKSLQAVYSIYAFLLFVLLMFIVILFVIPATFAGKIRGGNFIYRACSVWADVWLFLVGISVRNIYKTVHSPDEACIFVINHISYMDIPMVVKSIRQPIRVLAKVEMSKVPVFGYLYSKATVMVDRRSPEHRAKSVMRLKAILRRGISIVIFPEGTFNTTDQPLKEFFSGAFRIAIETNTPIQPVIFADTVERLHYNSIFSLTPGISRAIFLEKVPVKGLKLENAEALKTRVFNQMETALRSIRPYEPGNIESAIQRDGINW